MRIGVVTDVHGNSVALDAVLTRGCEADLVLVGHTHQRVAYDRDAVIAQARACGNPEIEGIVAHLRGERVIRNPIDRDLDVHEFEPPLEAKRA